MAKPNKARSNKENEKTAKPIPEGESVTAATTTESTKESTRDATLPAAHNATVDGAAPKTTDFEISMAGEAAASPSVPTIEHLAIAKIKRDTKLICRARGTDERTVKDYAAIMMTGTQFPAVTVFRDSKGTLWLADGFHRCAAAELAALTEIAAEVHQGDRNQALLFAASANGSHGLRRTNADKRLSVKLILPIAKKRGWSDRDIAKVCVVDHHTVARVKRSKAGEVLQKHPGGGGEVPQADALREQVAAIAKVEKALSSEDERAAFATMLETALNDWKARVAVTSADDTTNTKPKRVKNAKGKPAVAAGAEEAA